MHFACPLLAASSFQQQGKERSSMLPSGAEAKLVSPSIIIIMTVLRNKHKTKATARTNNRNNKLLKSIPE
jgi:hypothetical protein